MFHLPPLTQDKPRDGQKLKKEEARGYASEICERNKRSAFEMSYRDYTGRKVNSFSLMKMSGCLTREEEQEGGGRGRAVRHNR